MKKAEFLNKLNEELEKRNVADARTFWRSMSSTLILSWRTASLRRRSPRGWATRPYWRHSLTRRSAHRKRKAAASR